MFYAPVFYMPRELEILKLEHYDPQNEANTRFSLGGQWTTPGAFNHPPIKELDLRGDEEYVASRAKFRPVALFSITHPGEVFLERIPVGEAYLVIPRYSFSSTDPAHVREAVRNFHFSFAFHSPASRTFDIPDGFFRFDRAVVLPKRQLDSLRPYRISESALSFMRAWFFAWVTGTIADRDLAALIDLIREKEAESTPPPA